MPYPTRKDAIANLEKLPDDIAKITKELYNQVSVSLRAFVASDVAFYKAQAELNKIFTTSAIEMNFKGKFYDSVLETIANSSFTDAISKDRMGAITLDEFKPKLGKILAKGRQKTVNQAIRGRATMALEEQRVIINSALRAGKTVKETATDLKVLQQTYGANKTIAKASQIPQTVINKKLYRSATTARANIEQFGYSKTSKSVQEIDDYLARSLRRFKDGKPVNLKLDAAYKNLLKSINDDGKVLSGAAKAKRLSRIDNAIERAMSAKAEQQAMAVAQTESLNNVAEAKIIKALDNEDTQYVATITSGPRPCPYCLMVEDLGWQQVGQALTPNFHTYCSCSVKFKRTIERPEPQSTKEYDKSMEKHIEKSTKKYGKIYVDKTWKGNLPTPVNLRKAEFYTDQVNEV